MARHITLAAREAVHTACKLRPGPQLHPAFLLLVWHAPLLKLSHRSMQESAFPPGRTRSWVHVRGGLRRRRIPSNTPADVSRKRPCKSIAKALGCRRTSEPSLMSGAAANRRR